jgi:hypothetical protein
VHRRLFGAGVRCGTLLYRRSVWEQGHRFEDVSLGEDALFLRTAVRRGNRLAGVPGSGVFRYARHAWQPPGQFTHGWRDLGEPRELGGDREFYAALPGASPPGFRAVPDAGALSRI